MSYLGFGTDNISPCSFTFGRAFPFHHLPKPPFSWFMRVTAWAWAIARTSCQGYVYIYIYTYIYTYIYIYIYIYIKISKKAHSLTVVKITSGCWKFPPFQTLLKTLKQCFNNVFNNVFYFILKSDKVLVNILLEIFKLLIIFS